MEENEIQVLEFSEELYQKNIAENTFAEIDEKDGIGEEVEE